jgi:hypothetical protein
VVVPVNVSKYRKRDELTHNFHHFARTKVPDFLICEKAATERTCQLDTVSSSKLRWLSLRLGRQAIFLNAHLVIASENVGHWER